MKLAQGLRLCGTQPLELRLIGLIYVRLGNRRDCRHLKLHAGYTQDVRDDCRKAFDYT